MDVKRYHIEVLEEEYGKYVLYDDIKHLLTRPDPAEVERLVDVLIRIAKSWSTDEDLNKARADLLKAIQS